MEIILKSIGKRFEQEEVFNGLSYVFEKGTSTALLGKNGSGKSTLLQIIAGYILPTKGEVIFQTSNQSVEPDMMFQQISFCAPYVELIEELTLEEFLTFHDSFKKCSISVHEIIEQIGLSTSRSKLIEKFSSGMKQRVKLAQAIFSNAPILLLDEPCSNLDVEGISMYNKLIKEYAKGKTIVVASNDENEFSFCQQKLNVIDFKSIVAETNE